MSRRGGDPHAEHRQQRGVGEMEQHQGHAGDQQRRMAEQDGKPRHSVRDGRLEAAGGVIVNIAAADCQQGDQGKQGGTGHQDENAADAPVPGDGPGNQRSEEIPRMVEGFVFSHLSAKAALSGQPKGDPGD